MKSMFAVVATSVILGVWPIHAVAGETDSEAVFTIGVVQDGSCLYFDDLTERVKHELEVLASGEFNVAFKQVPSFSADWESTKVEAVLKSAMEDPGVDLVFLAGILAAKRAGSDAFPLEKPVVSGFVQDPDTVGLPYDAEGHSTKSNFNFVVVLLRSSHDLEVFHEMVSFTNLGVAVDSFLLEGLGQELEQELATLKKDFASEVTLLPLHRSAEEFLEKIPLEVDAVYLTPALRMDDAEWQQVIDGVNARGLPSFSLMGHQDVDAGVLAGLQPECRDRLARRIALNIQQIMSGMAPESLQVPMNVEESLVLNAETAAKIDYTPSFDILVQADILHLQALHPGKQLNYKQAVLFALENNIELARKEADVRGSKANRGRAMSVLLPQLSGDVQYAQIDNQTAAASMGTTFEKQTKAGVSVTQLLLNDPALAQFRASREIYQAGLADQITTELDVIQGTANAYIRLLQARALYRIEMNNLRLTRSNLELAKMRHEVGAAGPEEVYRWEAEAASGQAEVNAMESSVETAQIELNRIMGAQLQAQWAVEDIEIKKDSYYFLGGRLDGFVDSDIQFDLLQDFALDFAMQNSSELQQLDRYLQAARLELNQYRRRFVMPEIAARFDFNHTLDDEYAEAPATRPPDDEWMAGIQLELPFFQGGGRVFDVARAQAALDQLQERRRQVQDLVEQRVLNALAAIGSSFPNISLEESSAEFSKMNLAVIKNKYARGVVSILDLLDAQSQSFAASRRAEIARYSYLEDLTSLQRAMCWFEVDKTEAEKDQWADEFQQYVKRPSGEEK